MTDVDTGATATTQPGGGSLGNGGATAGQDTSEGKLQLGQTERDALPPPPEWSKDWTDEDRKAWGDKGKLDPNGVWQSYRKLENLMSSTQRVTLPKEGDAESLKAFHKAIGVPESADGYKLEIPEEFGDPEFGKSFAEASLAAGLTPKQVTALNQWWNKYAEDAIKAAETETQTEFDKKKDAAYAALRKEYGAEYQTKFNLADRTSSALGFTAQELLAIERAIGTEALIKRFADVGARIGEKGLVTPNDGGKSSGAAMTKEEANSYIAEIRKDSNLFKQISDDIRNKRDTEALRKWKAAHEAIA
jgi:hypothetical protein